MFAYQVPDKSTWAVGFADVSTGALRLGHLKEEAELLELIEVHQPKEVLLRQFQHSAMFSLFGEHFPGSAPVLSPLPEAILRDETRRKQVLKRHFGNTSLKSLPCSNVDGGSEALCGLLDYVSHLGLSTNQFTTVKPLVDPDTIQLGEIVCRDLEIFETSRRRQRQGSVFYEINRTCTPMGARLLRDYLLRPLIQHELIRRRQDAVASLLDNKTSLQELRTALRGVSDISRLSTRILSSRIQPQELGKLRHSLAALQELLPMISKVEDATLKDLAKGLESAQKPLQLLKCRLLAEPQNLGSGQGVFCQGFDPELDQCNLHTTTGSDQIAAYETQLRERTQISSLKIKNHKTFGLLIEVTKSNLSKVPQDFIRKQTMVNNERFLTPELAELNETLLQATDKSVQRELELYEKLLLDLAALHEHLVTAASNVAQLDVLQSLATKADEAQYCRPTHSKDRLKLTGSRHPVVETMVGRHQFIPNNVELSADSRHMLITGPNMAGKSTVMRQTALIGILHQIGSFVPAQSAELPIFDQFFTRVGASDDLSRGQSTFLVEMAEAAQILRHATADSFVILDEVGRGTSTQDGLAIAAAILEHLENEVGCMSLFATHYHELVDFAARLPHVVTYQVAVDEKAGEISFSHELKPGASGSSYGVEVAKIAGLPPKVVSKAQQFLIESTHLAADKPVASAASQQPVTPFDFEDVTPEISDNRLRELSDRLEKVTIHKTTPLQALNILNELKAELSEAHQAQLFD